MSWSMTRRDFLKIGGSACLVTMALPACLSVANAALSVGTERVPVLIYHDLGFARDGYTTTPSLFAAHMEFLYSSGYRAVSFKDFAEKAREGEKRIVITFDDGYASFLDYGLPYLEQYDFKATINIIGRHVGGFMRFGSNRPMLSWDEYRYLRDTGLVDLGCHTYALHRVFGSGLGVLGVSLGEFKRDLRRFQDTFSSEMGQRSELLAWPYGSYNKRSLKAALDEGFKYIMNSKEELWRTDSQEVSRLNISNKLDLISFGQYIAK